MANVQAHALQCIFDNPAISNPPVNSLRTNGGGLTRFDCITIAVYSKMNRYQPQPLLMGVVVNKRIRFFRSESVFFNFLTFFIF